MDTSQCDLLKFHYDRCVSDKLMAMKYQKPDIDCEDMFDEWKECYTNCVKKFIDESKKKKNAKN